jgi:type VI secretion system secreted protein VgrG
MAKNYEKASSSKFKLEITGCNQKTLVHSFTAQEEMSKPFMVNLTIACGNKISFDDVMGKEALLEIVSKEAGPRYFHGVIKMFSRAGFQGKYLYDITMVPYLDLLSMSTDCRIFQRMTVVEIVKKVFEQYKREIGTDKYNFLALKENGDKLKRRYCVQYRETDLDFISRILAEEGIFYYFEHYKDKHVIIFGDNTMNYKDICSTGPIAFNGSSNMSTDTESISSFDSSSHLTPREVSHSEYNFKNSSVKQKSNANDKSVFNLEVYDHPGNFLDENQGKTVSRIHLESLKTFETMADASSNASRLSAGFIFKMDKGKDVAYLVTSITHGGSQPQVLEEYANGQTSYSNGFVCIPATTVFRPPFHPKPLVTGLQSAVVVGPKGEEIHTDKHGRVRVQFHWDRQGKKDENSSCMLRVAQAWGGLSRGAQYIPRIGDEVLVEFFEGDPDRPIITGSVYNSDNTPIDNLKKSITQSGFRTKTHKGDGFHELRFDDAKGKEEIYLQSEKNWNILVKNRRGETVGGDSGTVVKKNCDISVGGDSYTIVTGKSTEIAKEIIIGASDKLTIVSGASSIVITPGSIEFNSPIVKVNCGGGAPMPQKRPVSGCTGKGGSSGGGGGGGSSVTSKPSVKSASTPAPAQPDDGWKAGPVKDVDEPTTEANDHLIYPDGTMAPGSVWGQGDLSADIMKHTPKGGGWTEIPPGGMPAMKQNTSGLGDLVSSATSSLPGDLVSNASRIASAVQNPESIKDAAAAAGRSKVAQALDKAKGAVLEKSGIGDMQDTMTKLSEKPKDLLGDRKINPDDVIKKM